jgi:hypothetical protein
MTSSETIQHVYHKRQRQFTLNILKGFGFGNRSMESTISEEAQHFVSFLE